MITTEIAMTVVTGLVRVPGHFVLVVPAANPLTR
jgi:hypothetical protein